MVRFDVHFFGRVQGVGFRYATCHVASHHEVAGYVRNLPDGRVRVVAEGEPAELEAFVQDVQRAMDGYVTRTTIDRTDANGEFGSPRPSGIEVRY